jgi:ribonuclease BN (tRNA processing enzyme)
MRLTVLGSSASYAGVGQACSGHLLEGGGARVLLDCGNGVLAHLARVADPLTLDAVFVTHQHSDHFADVFALQALLRYAPSGPAAPLPLYVPDGLMDRMKCLQSDRGAAEMDAAFRTQILEAGQPVTVKGLTVTPMPIEHSDPTYALRVETDGAVFVYTTDSAPTDDVVAAAEGADLLLAEATLPEQYAGRAPHLTARQAGEMARRAGAQRLVLAHIWATNDRDEAQRSASESFGAPVHVASEFDTFDIGN